MLSGFSTLLEKLSIVLASQSPRRFAILKENIGLNFEVKISGCEEDIDKASCSSPTEYVIRTARLKADAVLTSLKLDNCYTDLLIAADTIVVCNNVILEKPGDKETAKSMLRMLSGQSHTVLTAVSLACNAKTLSNSDNPCEYFYHDFVETTYVKFSTLDENIINAYVETGEPMDKAGSYGIQEKGSSLVRGVEGCYFNVVGFPVNRFCVELKSILDKKKLLDELKSSNF